VQKTGGGVPEEVVDLVRAGDRLKAMTWISPASEWRPHGR
jgi:hypothetical protein